MRRKFGYKGIRDINVLTRRNCQLVTLTGISFTLRRQDSSALRGLIEQADLLAYWRHTYDNVSSRTVLSMFVSRMTARVSGDRNGDRNGDKLA